MDLVDKQHGYEQMAVELRVQFRYASGRAVDERNEGVRRNLAGSDCPLIAGGDAYLDVGGVWARTHENKARQSSGPSSGAPRDAGLVCVLTGTVPMRRRGEVGGGAPPSAAPGAPLASL